MPSPFDSSTGTRRPFFDYEHREEMDKEIKLRKENIEKSCKKINS